MSPINNNSSITTQNQSKPKKKTPPPIPPKPKELKSYVIPKYNPSIPVRQSSMSNTS